MKETTVPFQPKCRTISNRIGGSGESLIATDGRLYEYVVCSHSGFVNLKTVEEYTRISTYLANDRRL